ncbi:NAD-P-binding protein [Lenzites betulinus]|nr:NAD-P-binding protein [Lenzites betulinus]
MPSTSDQTTWLITGASRGIGFELVRQLVESPNNLVIAACRTPAKATALEALKKSAQGTLHVIPLDVSDTESIRAIPKELEPILGESGLDYLINNAGIGVEDTAFNFDPEAALTVLKTNTIGPALVSQVCLPFLEKGKVKKVAHISSTLGSIASADEFGARGISYSMSKAALNMLTYKQKLERPDLTFLTLCPGWVKTDMGGQNAALEPKDSIAGILKVVTSATSADSGKYFRYNGEHIPW